MSLENTAEVKFEIGHVLFIDIVGCWKLLINEQSEQMQNSARLCANQTIKLTAPLQNDFSVFATAPCRGLSLSR